MASFVLASAQQLASGVDSKQQLIRAVRSFKAQVRSLETQEVLGTEEYQKPEQNQRHDIRSHARARLDGRPSILEFCEVEQTQNIAVLCFTASDSALASGARFERYDISVADLLIDLHRAPRSVHVSFCGVCMNAIIQA